MVVVVAVLLLLLLVVVVMVVVAWSSLVFVSVRCQGILVLATLAYQQHNLPTKRSSCCQLRGSQIHKWPQHRRVSNISLSITRFGDNMLCIGSACVLLSSATLLVLPRAMSLHRTLELGQL